MIGAALLATMPSAALAQDTLETADPAMVDTVDRDDEDNDFPWGLLGLLGLAGLLGRKRDNDGHVNRTDNNNPNNRM
ncbi:MAG: WGxxGxxG-CTERM domain-containing protein [Pseudomonadota bacterium]|nr:WGxxGxxG-CTERM domain-containing protein [Pseudomonadota bacterium]